jgi:hypothetical protein
MATRTLPAAAIGNRHLIAKKTPKRPKWLNMIGQDSRFHETHGYYAEPVDEKTSTLSKGWKGKLVTRLPGDTAGNSGLCLDPHDLAIAKYVARRQRDILFNRELAARGVVKKELLVSGKRPVSRMRSAYRFANKSGWIFNNRIEVTRVAQSAIVRGQAPLGKRQELQYQSWHHPVVDISVQAAVMTGHLRRRRQAR